MIRKNVCAVGVAGLVALSGSVASAQSVRLNVDPAEIASTGSTVALARYRLAQTNWDQALASSSTINSGTLQGTADLGNAAALDGVQYTFALSRFGGSHWTFSLTPTAGGTTRTVQWIDEGSMPAFNALRISITTGARSGVTSSSLSLSDLSFSSPSLGSSGMLMNMLSAYNQAIAGSGGEVRQWLVGDINLADSTFTLSGKVLADWAGTAGSNPEERLVMNISALQVGLASVIPLPPASMAGLGTLGGLAALSAFRRRR